MPGEELADTISALTTMTLEELRSRLESIENQLEHHAFVPCHVFERDGRSLEVCLTSRLRQKARARKMWKSKAFLTALKNASYGFDEQRARSRGGADGLFLLDRTFRPANEMMRKIFVAIASQRLGLLGKRDDALHAPTGPCLRP